MDIKPCNILITRKPNPTSKFWKGFLLENIDNDKYKSEFI